MTRRQNSLRYGQCMFSKPNITVIAFLVACVGIALFSVMDAAMKSLSIAIGAYNAMLWRQLVGVGIGGVGFFATRSSWPTKAALRLTMIRGGLGAVMAFTFFWGIARVPLAEGIALSFIAPLITLYLAAVILKERIGRGAITASMLGMIGVGVILAGRIGAESYDREVMLGIGAIFISAILYAYNLILQRQLAQISSPTQVAFFMNIFALAVTVIPAPFLAHVPEQVHWPLIVLGAVLAYVSIVLLSWAYARAEAQILIPVEYTAFIWAAILGLVFFNEQVTVATLIGTALIVAGCIIAARQKPERADHIEMA